MRGVVVSVAEDARGYYVRLFHGGKYAMQVTHVVCNCGGEPAEPVRSAMRELDQLGQVGGTGRYQTRAEALRAARNVATLLGARVVEAQPVQS